MQLVAVHITIKYNQDDRRASLNMLNPDAEDQVSLQYNTPSPKAQINWFLQHDREFAAL